MQNFKHNSQNISSDITHFVQDAFEVAVTNFPDDIALIAGEQNLTYRQLNEQANILCNVILTKAFNEEIIGISASRSIYTIIAVIAILKAGKAYLPLDPSYPKERLLYQIEDAGLKTSVVFEEDKNLFESLGLALINGDKNYSELQELKRDTLNSIAYVLYTSGSTGNPKGVCMGHEALVNLLQWQAESSSVGAGAKTLQFAPLTFDVSFQEIFATLTTGGTLVLANEGLRLDPEELLHFIEKQEINRIFLPFVALQYITEAATSIGLFPRCLTEVITAGEQLKITPAIEGFFTKLPHCSLINQYGPTECHVVTEFRLRGTPLKWQKLPPIGKAITNTNIVILDTNHQELPIGETGELCITGKSLAHGYLNNDTLTQQKFIQLVRTNGSTERAYLTGDLAQILPDGNIEYLGRKDDQVKIRGVRIELGEIEVKISHFSDIKQAVVAAQEGEDGQKSLIAYLVSASGKENTQAIKQYLGTQLPDYMIPSAFVWVEELPKTSSGKIDKKALQKPAIHRPDLLVLYKAPSTKTEKNIIQIWSKLLGIREPGVNDNFFELGGNSLLALKTVAALKNEFNYKVPITKLYQFATAAQLALFVDGAPDLKAEKRSLSKQTNNNQDIAVIGMAVRLPGVNTVSEFWNVLKEGKETTSFFTDEELSPYISTTQTSDPNYVKARGVIDNIEGFDASFFGINPKAAALMDPQQRIFLEIAWEVLEQTGHLPEKYNGTTGVYAGCGNNSYYINNVLPNPETVNKVGAFNVMTLNEKDYIASRTAFELNLKGPAVSVYSACSTSLLAVAQAVEAIRKGSCSIAIAGGSAVTSPVNSGHLYQPGGILSKDGHCRPFDKDATGTVFSDGAGVVLLKNLEQAKQDGDTIYSIIKGVGINNDGAGKGSFTAPSATGQAGVITMAMDDAGVQPEDISYVEAHGTATGIGDPIEIEGLQLAFGRQQQKQFCAIGSVKSNMGHLTAASGIAGLIKTVLSLFHKKIPPTLFFSEANAEIDFEESPFFVNASLKEWDTNKKRLAGVSSFGVGGTNVHVIAEEYENMPSCSASSRSLQLITWSAKSKESAQGYKERLASFLQQNHTFHLADVAYSLHSTRADFNHRYFTLASTTGEAIKNLSQEISSAHTKVLQQKPSEVVFMFPGQGAQYLNMGRDLYKNEQVYKQAIDECAEMLQSYLKIDIRDIIFPADINTEAEEKINNTFYTQPAIFITEYALAKLWMSWGIEPTVLCGHSIGELLAAHLAGIFNLKEVLKLVAFRSKMVSELPRGKMLSVRVDVDVLQGLLPASLSIAAVNSDNLFVVSGRETDIISFARILENKAIPNKVLLTSHAFHSAMMDPIIPALKKVVEGLDLRHPTKPIMSTVSGTWLTDAQAIDANYWANHVRETVCFGSAVKSILQDENPLFIEVGPGNVTASLVRKQVAGKNITVVSSLENKSGEYQSLLTALGKCWLAGLQPDWKLFYLGEKRIKLPLPAYAFDKKYCWINPPLTTVFDKKQELNPTIFKEVKLAGPIPESQMRKTILIKKIRSIIEDASGIELNEENYDVSFLEAGLDSLLLTQLALTLKKEFSFPITFRQLQEDQNTINSLAEYLEKNLPPDAFITSNEMATTSSQASVETNNFTSLEAINQQLIALTKQVAILQVNPAKASANTFPVKANNTLQKDHSKSVNDLNADEIAEIKKPFGATPKIERRSTALSPVQNKFLQNLIARYNHKTKGSKAHTESNRSHMADPRVVSGFSPLTKQLIYPIVVCQSKGSRLWDLDGNEYIDSLNGFGSNLFGYQPEFLKKALYNQIEKGFELGPQHKLAGEVTGLICEFTNFDRAALCNTGSEAVLGALRIARTVTGRSLVVAFTGSYHGINDEVIIRGTKKLKSFPAAPGIMPEAVQNMLILDYGTDETLQIIRERAHELAAVLVEPVQSRRPEFTPIEFLQQVRDITTQSNTVLIFDEVITGFRMHPGGAQAIFNMKADIATYGKVIGGGLPIGVIAGKKQYMDALDGGQWQYGDDSIPEVGVTYFAGTFVRHPLALATAKASLLYMKEKGAELQNNINEKAKHLATTLNAKLQQRQLPIYIAQFGSLWKTKFKEDVPHYELMFTLMREKGIHIWDGFPCFMTEAHTPEDVEKIISAFIDSVDEMIEAGFYKKVLINNISNKKSDFITADKISSPQPRLGRDKNGNPAWFISDPEQPGKYLQLKTR